MKGAAGRWGLSSAEGPAGEVYVLGPSADATHRHSVLIYTPMDLSAAEIARIDRGLLSWGRRLARDGRSA
jgi:hypothetical protein